MIATERKLSRRSDSSPQVAASATVSTMLLERVINSFLGSNMDSSFHAEPVTISCDQNGLELWQQSPACPSCAEIKAQDFLLWSCTTPLKTGVPKAQLLRAVKPLICLGIDALSLTLSPTILYIEGSYGLHRHIHSIGLCSSQMLLRPTAALDEEPDWCLISNPQHFRRVLAPLIKTKGTLHLNVSPINKEEGTGGLIFVRPNRKTICGKIPTLEP